MTRTKDEHNNKEDKQAKEVMDFHMYLRKKNTGYEPQTHRRLDDFILNYKGKDDEDDKG